MRVLALALLWACGDKGGAEGEEEQSYLGPLPEDQGSELDAEAISAGITSAVELSGGQSSGVLLDLYQGLLGETDAACPQWYSQDGIDYWYDSCTAESGTTFEGYGYFVEYEEIDGGDGNIWTGRALYAVATITSPEGEKLSLSGEAGLLDGDNAGLGAELSWSWASGDFHSTYAATSDSWLADEEAPQTTWYTMVQASTGGRAALADGLVPLEGDFSAVWFEEVFLYESELGSPCPIEPSGQVSLLRADGGWVDVVLDGAPYGEALADPTACDGCGAAWDRGQRVGDVCLDWGLFLDR
jgi:hypothetical protein